MSESIKELQKITEVTPRRGTDFLEIIVKHPSRAKAVLIANAIANVSVSHARTIIETRARRALKALDDELTAQEKLVAQEQKHIASILRVHEVPPKDPVAFSKYQQAKESYEQSRSILREMKTRQKIARDRLKKTGDPVTFHEPAT